MIWTDLEKFTRDSLEDFNLATKRKRLDNYSESEFESNFREFLDKHKDIKAVTVLFSDVEGRLHMLDYDKKFLLSSADNLTFDGSSIRGFTAQAESDLRLTLDWQSFYLLPPEFFGEGKICVFGQVRDKNGAVYKSDARSVLKEFLAELRQKNQIVNVAAEIEGFLFNNPYAEQGFYKTRKFEFVTSGGYYNCLPQDSLRFYIDHVAAAQRACGFENEKDHPEVAPAQFELNWKYSEALIAADQIQLYKLICRTVAKNMGYTASFLPKPVVGVNGSGMHTNISIADTHTKTNLFYGDKDGLSEFGHKFANNILSKANDVCLVLNSSVNSYRRLDPHYEAPNEIFKSPVDRGAMIRIPLGNSKSARIEVRSVAPDANPYMTIYTLLKAGLTGDGSPLVQSGFGQLKKDKLPDNIYSAIQLFSNSEFISSILGETASKFASLKQMQADRCPRLLGKMIKPEEIMYHHEVTNQNLWNMF